MQPDHLKRPICPSAIDRVMRIVDPLAHAADEISPLCEVAGIREWSELLTALNADGWHLVKVDREVPGNSGGVEEKLEALVQSCLDRSLRSAQAGDGDGETFHKGRADGVRAAIKELRK